MKASDIIRELLCLIDVIDRQQTQSIVPQPVMPEPIAAVSVEIPVTPELDDGPRRFKQIFDILSAQRDQQYANSPAEVIAGVESVTTDAGGGLNGPKHPADLRVKDPSMYPNYQGQ
jgi:hypothetical protein